MTRKFPSVGDERPIRDYWKQGHRVVQELLYRVATNRYVFYGSLVLMLGLAIGALSTGHEVLWRSTAALGTATVIVGLLHAWLDTRSTREAARPRRKRRAQKHG